MDVIKALDDSSASPSNILISFGYKELLLYITKKGARFNRKMRKSLTEEVLGDKERREKGVNWEG